MGNEGVSQLGNSLSKLKGLTNFIMAFEFDNLNKQKLKNLIFFKI